MMVPQELVASLPTFKVSPTQASVECVEQTKKRTHWHLFANYPLMQDAFLEVVPVSLAELRECAGQMHATALLARKQTIPPAWRPYSLLFFGTKWVDTRNVTQIQSLKYSRILGWRFEWCQLGKRLDYKKVRAVVIQQQTRCVAA